MEVGEVIVKNGVAEVILKTFNNIIIETEKLEDYIASITVINIDGDHKTLKQIINERSEDYINGVNVHEL